MNSQQDMPQYFGRTEREELLKLDELIRALDVRLDTPQGLMREHLTAARSYLLGAMPEEYKMTLDMAKEFLTEIDDTALRSRLNTFLASKSNAR